ncbi:MAG TPA: MgtC/SapB family protein [Fimbriiglobus sp.]|nr:MgtC/SapB family protein [Fimbriiglobus sp.]
MAGVADVLVAEFGDLSVAEAVQLGVRLTVAGVIGGLLGWQRELAGKAAGFRTHILVSVGTAAMVAVPSQSGAGPDAISRVMQGLITGIGFLGAGCILKPDGEGTVRGLTTAAGIWLTAAVGIAAGMGRELSALLIGGLGWFILSVLGRWEARMTSPDK